MKKPLINPLFDEKEPVLSSIFAPKQTQFSPIDGKPMQLVTCDGIEAWYDETNRLVIPVMKEKQ